MSGAAESVLAGGGQMGALMRSIDWSQTAVGPVERWPQSLRTALSILLETGFPMYIAWGREFTQFYNDGYRPILGSTKHPAAMGISTRETFAEIWDIIGPMFEGVLEGRATTVVDFMLPLDRHGFVEECYFIFSYSPIREEGGKVGGVLVTVTETTQRVLGERRLETTQKLAAETRHARTVAEACAIAGRVLEQNAADLPFAHIYLAEPDGRGTRLAASAGGGTGPAFVADRLRLDCEPWASVKADGSVEPRALPLGSSGPPGEVLVLPIVQQGAERRLGLLVAGTSTRLALDAAYRDYLALVASQIGTAIAGAEALEQAESRAEALALLDRAKTNFFSNVSHEFRTPLTLMLGPTEDALATPEQALVGADLETVHRNQLRLLKLVNTLLDFSRIEAGRVEASFEPTDLAQLTTDLASAFRSAMERAGLEFDVRCPRLSTPVHVDRAMWEKIVLNLLSNAFKFTFEGSIRVELSQRENHAELCVRDTGTGIDEANLARIFERFQRVERAAARTHEGSGIGLSLVKELVHLHGGQLEARSEVGRGSEFRVRIPIGVAHLPPERVSGEQRAHSAAGDQAALPYVEEALRWLPAEAPGPAASSSVASGAPRLLVADDNRDMRDYMQRLLSTRFRVEAASNGAEALELARAHPVDLLLSDVMMPRLDGFQLIAALRQHEQTRSIPVILLSARAGEEARIEALRAGADDYVVKPFSARELLARIDHQLMRARLRSLDEAHALRLANVFKHAPVGVAILRGPEHVFEFANEHYQELVGRRQLLGKPTREALPELVEQGFEELLSSVYTSGRPHVGRSVRVLLKRRAEAPEEAFFDFVYQPTSDEQGQVNGIAVVVFEVTELATAKRQAEAANRAKDEFLAMLGHELRNPLAPILTVLELMRLRNDGGTERERAIIERQVRHLTQMVDDLLDVSRIARGKVQLTREPVALGDVVAKAVEMTSPAIEEGRHALDVEVPHGLIVEGDALRLAQVFANLLANAAKYTEPGGRIGVRAQAEDDSAVIRVSDTGRGIDPDMLPRIFELFSQEPQEIDRSRGGLGLGLAIVKNLVQAHGGSVRAHSDGKARGTEVVVRLPLSPSGTAHQQRPPPRPSASSDGAPSLRVLIVDDNADAAELLADVLAEHGYQTRFALDGPRALLAAKEFRPHVALLDLGLPVMDGFELARKLRALPETRSIDIAAISGYGQELDRSRTREAGFSEHLVKPVDMQRLGEWLESRIRRASGQE